MSKEKGQNRDFDSLLDFQTKLEGVCNQLSKEMIDALDSSDAELLQALKKSLSEPVAQDDLKAQAARLKKICKQLGVIRKKAIDKAEKITVEKCFGVMDATQDHQQKYIGQFGKEIKRLPKKKASDIVQYAPFEGASISDWFRRYAENDMNRITSAIVRATSEGLTLADMVKVVRGSRENDYRDGVLNVSRSSAHTIARTLINGVANETRMNLMEENADVIDGVRFVATLDGKTSFLCASLDGMIWKTNEMDKVKRPPLHPNCRSCLVPYIEIRDEHGNIIETSGRPAANADFDKLAEDAYNAKAREKGWARRFEDLSASTRDKYYYKAQKDFEDQTGKPAYRNVPNRTNFREYFEKQPEEFKRSWLGETRYRLYSEGKLGFENLVKSDSGYVRSVEELSSPIPPRRDRISDRPVRDLIPISLRPVEKNSGVGNLPTSRYFIQEHHKIEEDIVKRQQKAEQQFRKKTENLSRSNLDQKQYQIRLDELKDEYDTEKESLQREKKKRTLDLLFPKNDRTSPNRVEIAKIIPKSNARNNRKAKESIAEGLDFTGRFLDNADIDISGTVGQIKIDIIPASMRSRYVHDTKTIELARALDIEQETPHEFAHALELHLMSDKKAKIQEFYNKITSDENGNSYPEEWLGGSDRSNEKYRRSNIKLPSKYCTKVCGDGTELFSMFLQKLYEDPANLILNYPDYYNGMIDCLR